MSVFDIFRKNDLESQDLGFFNAALFYPDFLNFVSNSDLLTKVKPTYTQMRALELLMDDKEVYDSEESHINEGNGLLSYQVLKIEPPYGGSGIIGWDNNLGYPIAARINAINLAQLNIEDRLFFSIQKNKITTKENANNLVQNAIIYSDGRIVGKCLDENISYYYLGDFKTTFGNHHIYCNKIFSENDNHKVPDFYKEPVTAFFN